MRLINLTTLKQGFCAIFILFFVSILPLSKIAAQCCTNNLVNNGDFESAFTADESFPAGASGNIATTGEILEWYYDDGTNTSFAPTFVEDATRASEGSQFMYVPFWRNYAQFQPLHW